MKDIIVICSYLLLLAASQPPGSAASQPPDSSTCRPSEPRADKEALIDELICIENHNKIRTLELDKYNGLSDRINGRDGSDCLATRCINSHELSLKLHTSNPDERVEIGVSLRPDGVIDSVTTNSEPAKPLRFIGILGSMPKGVVADSCQSKRLSYLQLHNNSSGKVTITSVELKLRLTDDSYKVVYESEGHISLTSGGEHKINKKDILNNKAFIRAKAGSCSDN